MSYNQFNFAEFIRLMSDDELKKYANASGTTVSYLKNHLIYKKKIPRPEMIESLVSAARQQFTKQQFVHWLYDIK